MKAGAGKAEIRIPNKLFPLEKFSAVHDPLYIRVLLLESGASFALVSVEMTSLRDYAVEEMRNTVAALTGLSSEQIWICVTHTFSAPHTRSQNALARGGAELRAKNQGLSDAINHALREAVVRAKATLQRVTIGYGIGHCQVNVSRDVETPQGWWLGQNEQGFSDHNLPVVRFDSAETSKTLAILYNYDVQSSIMDDSRLPDGTCPVTGDLTGAASSFVENAYGPDTTAIFLLGAAGDQAPKEQAKRSVLTEAGAFETVDLGAQGFELCQKLGAELGRQIVQTSRDILTGDSQAAIQFAGATCLCPGQKIMESRPTHPVKQYVFEPQEPRESMAELVLMGDIALIGVKPELSSRTAHTLRQRSPFPLTMVGTMVNGGAKYMPEASAYDRITYEAMNSAYGKGAAEIFAEAILHDMEEHTSKER